MSAALAKYNDEEFTAELEAGLKQQSQPQVDVTQRMLAKATRDNIEMLERQRDVALAGIKNDLTGHADAVAKIINENQRSIDSAMRLANDCAATIKAAQEGLANVTVRAQNEMRESAEKFDKMIASQKQVLALLEGKPIEQVGA